MDTRTGSFSVQRTYDDFVPQQHLLQERAADTLLLELPGFRKEHIKVQIDNYGKLRISGERPVGGNKWVRFRKEHQVPENCNFSAIRAKYENSLVSITLPKVIAPEPESTPDQVTAIQAVDKPASNPTEPTQQSGTTEKKEEKRSEPPIDPLIDEEKKAAFVKKDEEKKEEPKDTSKAANEAKHESTEESQDDTSESESESEAEEIISNNSGRLGMLKQKVGGLSTNIYNSRKAIWATFAVLVASIGVGLMINYNLNENNVEA